MTHFTDHDSVCIHCGMDTCDWPRTEKLPPCPVFDLATRAANVKQWQAEREPLWDEQYD
jgi:hypothetical protein